MAPARMTSLSPYDRPREKLERGDAAGLADHELLALVIGHGTTGADALTVAGDVLEASGGLHGLTRMSRSALCQVPGVGGAKAGRILAAVELGRRTLVRPPQQRLQLASGRELGQFLLPQFGGYPLERFGVVLLDTRLRLIRVHIVSIGSLSAAVAHPREVFREATIVGAAAVAVFHNHPSGDAHPSIDDVQMTIRLARAGEILGIDLWDHVVLGDAGYCSMRESKLPPWGR